MRFTGLRSGLPFLTEWGFPEFTRFFNPPFGGKLRFGHSHLLYRLSYPGI